MRNLTSKQKKILDKYKHINSMEELPYDVYEKLEKINNTEILYQNVDMYLRDKCEAEKVYYFNKKQGVK